MTISTRLLILPLLPLGFALGTLAACYPTKTILNEDHCAVNSGDAYCAEQFPDKPFCQLSACNGDDSPKWGCVAEQPSAECWAECGVEVIMTDGGVALGDLIPCDGTDTESSGSETADTTDTTDATETTGPMLCQGPEDCVDPALPFCDMNGACVACDGMPDPDGACASADANLPVCFEGSCVACAEGKTEACVGTTPICNTETNVCEGCSEHEQCPDSACNMAAGNCMDPGVVVHVDGDTLIQDCPNSTGTEAMPYCTISAALADAGTESVIILHEREGMDNPYAESNAIAIAAAILAASGEAPKVSGFNANPSFTVTPSGAFFVRGLRVASNTGDAGMLINGGSAWIERSEIVNNTGGGIVVDGSGMLMLENSFVGGDINDQSAINIVNGAAEIKYVTVAAGFGAATSITCANGAGVTIRNSLMVARTDLDEVQCPGAEVLNCALEMMLASNTALGAMTTAWFSGYMSGDFHLNPGVYPTEIETAALWETGDPTTDIDGDSRPVTDGTPDFAGADRIP
jgi:hypothetical protein